MMYSILIFTTFLAAITAFPTLSVRHKTNYQQWALSIPRPARFSHISTHTTTKRAVSLNATAIPNFSNTKITSTDSSLTSTASTAISRLLSHLKSDTKTFSGLSWWQSANAYTAIIDFDLHTSSQNYKDTVGASLLALIPLGDPNQQNPQGLRNGFNDDTLWWALACLDAYEAYGDSEFLQEAKRLWEWVKSTSVIVQTGIAPNMGGIKRTHVVSNKCDLKNGVYWTTNRDESYINSITTGLFMQVSARLYEVETSARYLSAATGAGDWLRKHTVDESVKIVDEDGVNGETCSVNAGTFTYNTGKSLHDSVKNTANKIRRLYRRSNLPLQIHQLRLLPARSRRGRRSSNGNYTLDRR